MTAFAMSSRLRKLIDREMAEGQYKSEDALLVEALAH